MTTFLDGPAQGTTLFLQRAPHFLRVVKSQDGTVDALDQLHDTPAATETLTAYEMVSGPRHMHVNRGRKGCSWYRGGDYRLVATQPDEATLRDTTLWRAWVSEQIGAPVAADGTVAEVG